MEKRKSKRGNFEIEKLDDFELPTDIDSKVQKMTEAADSEIDATRVNFRWQREPLTMIKRVASAMGVPYQTYIKQVLYRQALEDLRMINTNATLPQASPPFSAPPQMRVSE